MGEIALNVLSSGRSLVYGGDLRGHGFTELLAELVGRYRGHPRHSGTIEVTNFLAWPVHIRMTPDELVSFSEAHDRVARLVILAMDGTHLAMEQRLKLPRHEPQEEEWAGGLTAMRNVVRKDVQARIVLGGRIEGYKGEIPGIAEETYLSLEIGQPVFLLGGFGGCARDIAETLGLAERLPCSRGEWAGRERFRRFSSEDLNNGLSREENATLARTSHILEAVALVSRGLRCSSGSKGNHAQSVHLPSPPQ